MNNIFQKIALIAVCLWLQNVAMAQDGEYIEVRDLETWTSAKLKFKADKKWTLGLEGQMRLDKNSLELKSIFGEFTTQYKINKNFRLIGGMRYTNSNDNSGNVQGFDHYIRYNADAVFKHDIERFDFQYRLRYTNKNEIGLSSEEGDVAVQYLRLKAEVAYNIRKWKLDPEIAGEIFRKQVKNGQSNGFNNVRFTTGTSYKIKGYGNIGLYYRMERELTSYYPKTTNLVLLKYSYTIKNKKK
jgi:hypothetical protein